jgi:hypothetical protein
VGLLTFLLASSQLGNLGIVWDEPFFWDKQLRIQQWFGAIVQGGESRTQAFTQAGLKNAWPYCVAPPHENPPVYAEVSALTDYCFRPWLGELHAKRLSSAILFSVVAGGIMHLAYRNWGLWPALAATGAWVLNPRVFAHGRLSTIDMPVTAFWFLSAWMFFRACEQRRGGWWVGPLWGLSIMSKFSGFIAGPCNALWAIVYRQSRFLPVLIMTVVLTPMTMVLVHPGWWFDPLAGFREAVDVHRNRHIFQVVPTHYLGTTYEHSLPWHNTIVLLVCCVPVPWIALAGVGVIRFLAGGFRSPLAGWVMFNWLGLMIVRSLPIAPGHDGIRQFLASFPFFALLVGFGADALIRFRRIHLFGAFIVMASLGWSLTSWLQIRPFELSYYNEVVGGLPGANRLGLESSYWWDAVTPEFLRELDHKLPNRARVGLSAHFLDVFNHYQRLGRLRKDIEFIPLQKLVEIGPWGTRLVPTEYIMILRREGFLRRPGRPDLAPIMSRFERAFQGPVEAAVEVQGIRILILVKSQDV